ncbi:MAG: SDH family Clp fold serine proteinase [Sulfurifustaceae bacterium]
MGLTDFIWLYLLISILTPMLQRRWIEVQRVRLLRRIELMRGSRVITMIHRQESFAFLGVPFARYINIEDSEAVLRAVRLTPPDMPIDIVLHTPGGLALTAEQIAEALLRHKAPVTVIVPHYAMSGGTMIALAADQILVDRNAVLGPLDPQVSGQPAAAILEAVKAKPIDKVDDSTLILASIARRAMTQIRSSVIKIVTDGGQTREQAERIADLLATGQFTHDYAIDFEEARAMGLPIKDELPKEIYLLMDLYPQPARATSVQYIPQPYRREPAPAPERTRPEAGR